MKDLFQNLDPAGPTPLAQEKEKIRNAALARATSDLNALGIRARRDGKTLRGEFKGFPFIIYVYFVNEARPGGLADMLVTRYKRPNEDVATDRHGIPADILGAR